MYLFLLDGGLRNLKTYLLDDLLVKIDRMSMANSLEARSPFLDKDLMEYVAFVPDKMKIKGLNLKYILKKSFHGILPDSILKRKKHGFGVPLGRWFSTDLLNKPGFWEKPGLLV